MGGEGVIQLRMRRRHCQFEQKERRSRSEGFD